MNIRPRLSTEEWVEIWLAEMEVLVPRTVPFYRKQLSLILPALGQIPLAKLSPQIIKHAILTVGHNHNGTTLSHVHVTLKQALDAAVEEGRLEINPMRTMRTPAREDFEARPLTESQALRLVRVCAGHRHGLAVVIALQTGMRSGEIVALEWSDISFHPATITTNKTVSWERGPPVLQRPKTRAAHRVLPISDGLAALLRRQRVTGNTLVIASRSGSYLSRSTLRDYFIRALDEAHCPRIRFHDLRHTAGLFLTRTSGLVVASRMLGHASPLITARYYGHAQPEDLRAAADAMGDLLTP